MSAGALSEHPGALCDRPSRVLLAGCLAVLAGATLLAQDPPVFRAGAQLVVQTVTVTDPEGHPIEGLTPDDFVVLEDGVPQTVALLEYQELPDEDPDAPISTAGTPVDTTLPSAGPAPAAATSDVIGVSPIASSPTGDIRYQNRRLLILYFDATAMPPPDQTRAYTHALRFIDTEMQPADLVAVMSFQGGAVRVRQDFTDDRAKLRLAVLLLMYNDDLDGDGIPDVTDPTAFGQGDAEFNVFNTDRQLSALQTAVSMLRPLPEQKSLIYFASGLRLTGADNQAQMRATVNAAVRANVAIFPIDARGLVADAPLGDATQASPGGITMFSGRQAEARARGFQRSQDTLYALAADTGGRAEFNSNDLAAGIVRVARSQKSYYILGYYTSQTARDGRFRRVEISLADPRALELAYRRGYYADKEFARFTDADKERQLEEALMLENPITDITIAMEVNYFQINSARYFVPVAVKIPGSELELARRRGAARTRIDFIGEVRDDYGNLIQNVRDGLDIRLTDETAVALSTRPVQYETGFTLLPGDYVIKFLARDATTGRIGTFLSAFTVPNLTREAERLPISSVVLSSQRVPWNEALFTVDQEIGADMANPLVHQGQKLIPSVTRVFSAGRQLYVFLQTYQRDATEAHPLVVYASFYQDGVKAFETQPLAVTETATGRSGAVPLRFSVPLSAVAPGRYECQISVLDPTGQKVAFWRAPIAIVPETALP